MERLVSFQDESGTWIIDVPLVKLSGGLIYFRREDGSLARTRLVRDTLIYLNPYSTR